MEFQIWDKVSYSNLWISHVGIVERVGKCILLVRVRWEERTILKSFCTIAERKNHLDSIISIEL